MALLSTTTRNSYIKAVGFESILDFQKKAFTNKKEWDGVYGTKTDNALRTWYNVYKYTKNFKPSEFKCKCGKCSGYPSYMKPEVLKGIQEIRTKYGKTITITSGLRCSNGNNVPGASSNSKHLTGYAVDFYQKGVTDTLANRKKTILYVKNLSGFNYSYGNGWSSTNVRVDAPNMGNALHIDFKHVEVKTTSKTTKEVKTTTKTTSKTASKTTKKTKTTKAEKLAKMAESLSWPYGTPTKKWAYKTGSPTSACKEAMQKRGYKNKISYSDCGYFQNTIIYKTFGTKVKVLLGNKDAFPSVSGFEIVHKGAVEQSKLKRGDIIRYKKTNGHQHVLMYLGNGRITEAGRGGRFGRITKSVKYTSKDVKKATLQVLRVKE